MDLISTLTENPYFSAGFGLFGVGALAAASRKCTNAGLVLFRRHCITTLGMYNFCVIPIRNCGQKGNLKNNFKHFLLSVCV